MRHILTALFATMLLVTNQGFTQNQSRPLQDPDLKKFTEAANAAGIRDLFEGTGPFTVFAPSNAAFEKFGTYKLKQLEEPKNHDTLIDLIMYHVLPGKYMASTLKTMDVKTTEGKEVHIVVENGEIRVNNAKVIRTDMVGPNGVVHIIDTVLEPK